MSEDPTAREATHVDTPAAKATQLSRGSGHGRPSIQFMLILLIIGVIAIMVVGLLVVQGNSGNTASRPPEITLTLWLIFGVAALLLVLMAVALVSFLIDGNKVPRSALALPEGSVSAILALLLLLVFSIFTIYLYGQMRNGEPDGVVSTGLTAEEVKALPQDRIAVVAATTPESTPRTFNVTLSQSHSASDDFARSAAATVATLLAAVAGFYFGQRATTSGVVEGKKPVPSDT